MENNAAITISLLERERARACMLLFIKTDIYFMHRECKMIAGDIVGALL